MVETENSIMEFYDNLPQNEFDLTDLNEEERRQINEFINNDDSDSGDDLDDDNIPLFF